MLDDVSNFIWQPYLQPSEFETFSFSGREEQCATALGRVELYLTICPNFIPSISEDKEDLDLFTDVYSPDRVMRQLGYLQDVPSPHPRSLNSKIRHCSPMELRCVLDFSGRIADLPSQLPGNAANANVSHAYSCYWRGVLCRFKLFVEASSPQLELGPITSSRLASPKTVLTYAEKHNLTYTEVYSDGTRKIVDYLKGFEAKGEKNEGRKHDKKASDKGNVKEQNTQNPIRRFKPKVDFDKFMHMTCHGVKLMIPPSTLLQKNKEVKKKTSSTSRASGTSHAKQVNATSFEVKKGAKRKANVDFDVPLRRSNRVKSMSSTSPRGPPVYLELAESDHGEDSQRGPTDSSKEDHTNFSKVASDHVLEMPPMDAINRDGDLQWMQLIEMAIGGVSNDNQVDAEFEPLQHSPSENENNDQEQNHPSDVGESNDGVGHDTAVHCLLVESNKHALEVDKMTIIETQGLDPSLPAKGLTSEWATHMNNFMIRFASKEESAPSIADVAPTLNGDTADFVGMKIPSELAGPLARFAERYSRGDIFNLINRDYTSRKKCELVKELGMMLYSMEVCQIKDGEVFLIWRDACCDFMGAGLNVGFLLDSLKQGAQHFFVYMIRPGGSEN
ncbi:hypothetical protein RchiOBHm_Chr5g0047301 [Rosa chinensis]|uniref:Uncharacterized protein n=1 Tax=Rosa chinensis TaxID=74649 RepID=A0A2P6QEB0_ROSCH|nr:hypothetical protein RchiOBHm_Chr5g0047301 [Rosa chinensis]